MNMSLAWLGAAIALATFVFTIGRWIGEQMASIWKAINSHDEQFRQVTATMSEIRNDLAEEHAANKLQDLSIARAAETLSAIDERTKMILDEIRKGGK